MVYFVHLTRAVSPSSLFEIAFLTSGSQTISSAGVFQPCGIGDCMLLFIQGLSDGCPLRGISESLQNCAVVTILGVLKVFHTICAHHSIHRVFFMHTKQNIISIVTTLKPNTKRHKPSYPNGNKISSKASVNFRNWCAFMFEICC